MSFIEKALILHTSNDASVQYANECAESCEKFGVPYELFLGVENCSIDDIKEIYDWDIDRFHYNPDWRKEYMCSFGHAFMWEKIADEGQTVAVLEHDAIVKTDLRKVNVEDGYLSFLGYRMDSADDYEVPENPEFEQFIVPRFFGTHGYGITANTAQKCLDMLQRKMPMPIDGVISINNLLGLKRTIVVPNPIVGVVRGKSQTMKHEQAERRNILPPECWWDNVVNKHKYTKTYHIHDAVIEF